MTLAELSALENESIREFVAAYPWHGRVLDFGCGEMPYRRLLQPHADYLPWNRSTYPGCHGSGDIWAARDDPLDVEQEWDAILCTQVLQYIRDVYRLLRRMREALRPGGALVLTYPGAWPEIPGQLHSFTAEGMANLLRSAGFTVESHVVRGTLPGTEGFSIPFGHGTIARA